MSYRLINFPHFVSIDQYHTAINKMLERVCQLPQVVSVYNIGSVSNPGISDIDMVVVTRHGATVNTNFLQPLTPNERYLFTHNLYAISEGHFANAEYFTFFHNYSLAYGTDIRTHNGPSANDVEILKRQVAKEFIIKMYIHLFVQEKYKVLRIRDLLLHVKALMYDFEFLGITEGKVVSLVQTLINWRKIWFTKQPGEKEILTWWREFYNEFEKFTKEVLSDHLFYVPNKPKFAIAKNIVLSPAQQTLTVKHNGIVLPSMLSFTGKRFFRLQNRLNHFDFNVSVADTVQTPSIVADKFIFENALTRYGKQHLPFFLPLTSSLHLQ